MSSRYYTTPVNTPMCIHIVTDIPCSKELQHKNKMGEKAEGRNNLPSLVATWEFTSSLGISNPSFWATQHNSQGTTKP